MWFRQVQIFQLTRGSFRTPPETLAERLGLLAFSPCLPSMPFSMGWAPPAGGEDDRLFRMINDCIMLCLETEEKILPATVVRQFVQDKVRKIETEENRKVYAKEKNTLKDEMIMTLLPRAFTRRHRVYGYIDLKKQWLILGTANAKRAEQFVSLFKKSLSEEVTPLRVDALSEKMTQWVQSGEGLSPFSIGDACVMQDKAEQGRVIRCRQQDLCEDGIQSLLKTGCQVRQLALTWQDQMEFILADPFVLQSVRFQDEIVERSRELEPETEQQQFDADFFIFSGVFSLMFGDLMQVVNAEAEIIEEAVA